MYQFQQLSPEKFPIRLNVKEEQEDREILFQEKPLRLIEAKRMVSISSGLDLDAAHPSSLLASPEKKNK